MKIKTISRNADEYVPVKSTQESQLPRNLDPALHPFERAREYTKALTATKLERMFAKPFVGQLGYGHRDGCYVLAKNYNVLNKLASGSADGVVKYWNMATREELCSFRAHYGLVTGLCVTPTHLSPTKKDSFMLSCGDDKTIKLWSVNSDDFNSIKDDTKIVSDTGDGALLKTFYGEHAFQSIDHHRRNPNFVTGGAQIQLWDVNRKKPLSNLSWGVDNVSFVRFNQNEEDILASTGSDNSIVLYDLRTNSPTQKVVQRMRTNALCWNPMEPFNFAIANEDHNAYYYDMRNMSRALHVFKDHVSAVMDVDFSPTGEEIVTGSYDKTIRIFNLKHGHSREVYHTKRMQHVFQVKFTMDSKYIVSGSDDGNVRLWRAKAWERSHVKTTKEKNKLEYDEKLKERFKHMPEIRRISKHRHVPKVIKKAQEIKNIEIASLKRREGNERRTRKDMPFVSERKKQIVGSVHSYEEKSSKADKEDDDQ
ncbi:AAL157Cp [Eremothecium gossypii ATCC 10895]|uniref:AAL157Cp n=1 Tax=Eremothecium gossypii (strain ATCC 10895 / CBS 109.51 / FGSC 9923 / NRRL Y-1056) TaxID=284811 RepID=Q75F99_EREGS|nr:AAL157Cp [Eremothecium gossypii ATCC 10895]AAS50209.1 AAL157Cp [Eremothecium gossypii ATCC 10895]AEY94494.1 FAAL157Cp [Eremothecium gossypii FDAG1]